MYRCILSTFMVMACATAAFAETQTGETSDNVYVTYRTVEQGNIDFVFDQTAFSGQGWGIIKDTISMPMNLDSENMIEVVTHNGNLLRLNGTPRAIGVIELQGPENVTKNVAGFTLDFSGHNDVTFVDGTHPIFEIIGDTLVIEITPTELTITGDIRFHDAAADMDIDTSVGTIGYFQLTATTDVTDVDAAISPERLPNNSGDPGVLELPGADVIVGSLPSIWHWTSGGAVNGMRAYSVATTSCNIGTQPLDWFVGPNVRHPVIGQNMYRLKDGRFQQIGQSWLKHGFCALQQNICSPPNCSPVCGGCCAQLGVGCSDPYSANRNGQFSNLGPKSEINAHLGTNLGNHAFAAGHPTLRGRIIVPQDELDPAQNPGAVYFVEGHYIAQDDAQFGDLSNDNNNASYRKVNINPTSYFITGSGATIRERSAIHAWKAEDPNVEITEFDIPGEGHLLLACRVTDNGDGTWRYEYAMQNLNSDRSARAFSIPISPASIITNQGFSDVDYHSGEPYDLTDWVGTEGGGSVTWETETFAANPNANALRWSTMYNFWFTANSAPVSGQAEIGVYKTGGPMSVSAAAFVPSEPLCPAPELLDGEAGTSFADRAFDGFIDARMESDNGKSANLGMTSFTVHFNTPMENNDGSSLSAASFTVTDSSGASPNVASISTEDSRIVTVNLSEGIHVGEWTTLAISARSRCAQDALSTQIQVGFLPADVDNSGASQPLDLLRMRQALNGVVASPDEGVLADYYDIDRNGTIQALDLLRWRQLWFGQANATQAWEGAALP